MVERQAGQPGKPAQEGKPATRLRKFWRNWVKPFALVLLVLFMVRSAVADWNDVPTGSMKPTILEGDRILVNKLAYDVRLPFVGWRLVHRADPERGDVIVFASPADGTRLVKRVVGLPGDVVEVKDNRLRINGSLAGYQPLAPRIVGQIRDDEQPQHQFAAEVIEGRAHPVMVTPGAEGPANFGPVTVPASHYFVMGDNRDNSLDSRFFGPVPRDAIEGRATSVVLSVGSGGFRWDRFFHKMD